MLVAAVVELEAVAAGALRDATGDDVHGLWFAHWAQVAPAIAQELHAGSQTRPYTLSPLLGLPRPDQGRVRVEAGQAAWFRATALDAELAQRLADLWLARLPDQLAIGGLLWRVRARATQAQEHPLAETVSARALADRHLLQEAPLHSWRLRFVTPTAFHGTRAHIPLPMPNMLLSSWWRRWQERGPVLLPDDTVERLQDRLAVSAYRLQTVPLRYRGRTYIGCVGDLTLRALDMAPRERAVISLLTAFAFWAGSGHHTAQGMGLTLPMGGGERHGRDAEPRAARRQSASGME